MIFTKKNSIKKRKTLLSIVIPKGVPEIQCVYEHGRNWDMKLKSSIVNNLPRSHTESQNFKLDFMTAKFILILIT